MCIGLRASEGRSLPGGLRSKGRACSTTDAGRQLMRKGGGEGKGAHHVEKEGAHAGAKAQP